MRIHNPMAIRMTPVICSILIAPLRTGGAFGSPRPGDHGFGDGDSFDESDSRGPCVVVIHTAISQELRMPMKSMATDSVATPYMVCSGQRQMSTAMTPSEP